MKHTYNKDKTRSIILKGGAGKLMKTKHIFTSPGKTEL